MSDWKAELSTLLSEQDYISRRITDGKAENRAAAIRYFSETVVPTFTQMASEIKKTGRDVRIDSDELDASLVIHKGSELEFSYTLFVEISSESITPLTSFTILDKYGRTEKKEKRIRYDRDDYSISEHGAEEIADDFITAYGMQLHRLNEWDAGPVKSVED